MWALGLQLIMRFSIVRCHIIRLRACLAADWLPNLGRRRLVQPIAELKSAFARSRKQTLLQSFEAVGIVERCFLFKGKSASISGSTFCIALHRAWGAYGLRLVLGHQWRNSVADHSLAAPIVPARQAHQLIGGRPRTYAAHPFRDFVRRVHSCNRCDTLFPCA